jgi:hypothetical protein
VSAYSGDDIDGMINALANNYKTIPEVDLPHYIAPLCGITAALITIPSAILFNAFGLSQRQGLISSLFNDK